MRQYRRYLRWGLLVLATLCLASMVLYPFCYDQAVFGVGGDMVVAHGKVAYRDLIDTKPPLIFLIYGTAAAIFGHHEWSVRLLDALYHIVSLFVLYRVLRRFTGNETLAFTSCMLYVLIYVGSGYEATAQSESFALLPNIGLVAVAEQIGKPGASSVRFGILAGLLAAILFLLKFTLPATLVAAVFGVALTGSISRRDRWSFALWGSVSLAAAVACYLGYLFAVGGLARFIETFNWLRTYVSSPSAIPVSGQFVPDTSAKLFPGGMLLEFGMTIVVLMCIGLFIVVRNRRQGPRTMRNLAIQFLFGLCVVYYERKSFPYLYARLLFAVTPIAAAGLLELGSLLRGLLHEWRPLGTLGRFARYALVLPVAALALYYSPLTRLWKGPFHYAIIRFQGQDAADDIQSHAPAYYYKEVTTLAESLRPRLKPADQIFVWGRTVLPYFLLDRIPTTICLNPEPISDPVSSPASWRSLVIDSLAAHPPRYVIAGFDDFNSLLAGVFPANWSAIERWPELSSFVAAHYDELDTIGHFRIFEYRPWANPMR